MKKCGMDSGFSTIFILSKWREASTHKHIRYSSGEHSWGFIQTVYALKGQFQEMNNFLNLFLCFLFPGLALKFDLFRNYHLILKIFAETLFVSIPLSLIGCIRYLSVIGYQKPQKSTSQTSTRKCFQREKGFQQVFSCSKLPPRVSEGERYTRMRIFLASILNFVLFHCQLCLNMRVL